MIDAFLNKITMYRLVVYGLLLISAGGFIASAVGRISFSPVAMLVSLILLVASTYLSDALLSKIWKIPANSESWLITALILFLIIKPTSEFPLIFATILAAVVASASKFMITWNGKHIFNPAAFAAAVLSLTAILPTVWWVGNSALWPITLLVGLAVVRKIRRFPMVITFVFVAVSFQLAIFAIDNQSVADELKGLLISSPLIFLATIMLTEPATMPPRRTQQIFFAAIVAVFYVTAFEIGPLYIYPEVALLLGNIYAFVISPKAKLQLRLIEIQKISDRVSNFVFESDKKLKFTPGQYMEWTLPGVPFDSRGNRRTLTTASSPTEETMQIGLKQYEPSSNFKKVLFSMSPGDPILASQLKGNFTLPKNKNKKLVFVAGGIGITPFRSMLKYLVDTHEQRDIILLYFASSAEEIAYMDVFKLAANNGVRIYTSLAGVASFDPVNLQKEIPDLSTRTFYISGPNGMVDSVKHTLKKHGVASRKIKTDHFSGY